MQDLTLPNMPDDFTLSVESFAGARWLSLSQDNRQVAIWEWMNGFIARDNEFRPGFEAPDAVMAAIDAFVAIDAQYPWAENAHAPRNDGEDYPLCGLGIASREEHSDNPVVKTADDLWALAEEQTCWECRSILA